METTFDPLQALSLARTALDDPDAIDPADLGLDPDPAMYAVDRIDEAIGALHFDGSNDYVGEAHWVITHLGRLLAAVAEKLEAEADPDHDLGARKAALLLVEAGGKIDRAIEEL
jgi:hypothetical protein